MIPFADPVGYLAAPILTALLLFSSAYLLGSRLARGLRLELRTIQEQVAVAATLGLALLGLAGAALGFAGGYRTEWVLALLAAPALLLGLRGLPRPEPAADPDGGGAWIRHLAHGIVLLLAVANLVRALYPPSGFDALNYQLPAVAHHLDTGSLGLAVDLRFAAGPAMMQVLFVLAAAVGGDLAVQLVSFGAGLLGALAVGALSGRIFGPTAGAAATAIFYATPIVGWLSSEAYVDLGLVLFLTVALHAVLVRLDGGGIGWVLAGGLAAGAALGTRYLALLPVGVLLLDLMSAPGRAGAAGTRRRLTGAVAFLGSALLVALPWYGRNLLETGNAFFPLFNDLLGGSLWTAADVEEHGAYLRAVGPGRGFLDLFILPLRLSVDPAAFEGSTTTGIGFAYLLLVPAALVRIGRCRQTPLLLSYAVMLGIGWFMTSQQTRFLLPSLAALAVLGGGLFQAGAHRRVGLPLLALLVVLAGGTRWPTGPPPAGADSRDAWLRDHVPGFDRVRQIGEFLPEDSVLYAFGQEGLRYYQRTRALGDWFGPTAYRKFLPEGNDRRVLTEWLRLGVTHVLIVDTFPSRGIAQFRESPFWWDHLVPLASWEGMRLYRLRTPPLSPEEARIALPRRGTAAKS